MHEYHLLEIMALGFALALVFGCLAYRFNLSPIIGYLLAGFLIGPHTPGFVADPGLALQLSEAGVILLMFGVGLHFNTGDLLAVKDVAVPGAIIQIAAATLCGFIAARLLNLTLAAGLTVGLGLAVASTVVLLRVLVDNNMINTVHGHVAVGWLVVEDIFTVLVLVLLPSLASIVVGGQAAGAGPIVQAGAGAILRLVILWLVVVTLGGRLVPWLLIKVARTRSQELFTLTVLMAAFATAVGAAVVFKASLALGAFLGGMVVGKSKVSHQAAADLLPLRDAFAVLFFLSVGMLFDPAFFVERPFLVACCLLIVILVKPLTAMMVVALLGYSARTALVVAVGLAQVGEFSFILAQEAQKLNLVDEVVYSVVVICALISITLNPGLFKQIPRAEAFLKKQPRLWKLMNTRADRRALKGGAAKPEEYDPGPLPDTDGATAIVAGYGPTGQNITKALLEKGLKPIIVDTNVDTVNSLKAEGRPAVFGDSTRREVLEAAGVKKAVYLLITLPAFDLAAGTASLGRALNPNLRILVRTRFLKNRRLLEQIGVAGIAFEEEEVAQSMTRLLLKDLEYCRCGRPKSKSPHKEAGQQGPAEAGSF